MTFAVYHLRLAAMAEPLELKLATIGVDEQPPVSVPVPGPTLKELLKSEEDAGTMRVVETGPRTVVTLVGADLFRSGSAEVNPVYNDVIGRLTDALNRVPGRGPDHRTHRRPADPDAGVSQQHRAVAGAGRERRGRTQAWHRQSRPADGDRPWRLETAASADTPENRARNRRVEIVHLRG